MTFSNFGVITRYNSDFYAKSARQLTDALRDARN